jgi:hypothetical protein
VAAEEEEVAVAAVSNDNITSLVSADQSAALPERTEPALAVCDGEED